MGFLTWNRELAVGDAAAMDGTSVGRAGSLRHKAAGLRDAIGAGLRRARGFAGITFEGLRRGIRSAAPGRPWGVRKRRMEMVESLTLGGRKQLFLVECDRQRYLVGGGAEGVATIVAMGDGEGLPLKRSEATGTRGLRLVRRRLDAEGHWAGLQDDAPKRCEPWR